MKRVFIREVTPFNLKELLSEMLRWLRISDLICRDTRVFIKPNLTWKVPTPGVTVTPAFLRALIENLLELTPHITVGESEGGQACFQAEEAFESHGLYDLEREYDIRVINLSKVKHERVTEVVGNKPITVELPSMLLHEVDVFITVPVPKVHAMTKVSLGFKNQWGCLGDKMRVTQHPQFDRSILAINKLLKPRLCIFDGTYFLDHTGPMMGNPVKMDLIIGGNDAGAASLACCSIMQIDPMSVRHLRLARKEKMLPESLEEVTFNKHPSEFSQRKFILHRAFINYIHIAAFKNGCINRLFYASKLADVLHEFLWYVRRSPVIKRALYGLYGTGEANRGGGSR